MQFDSFDSTCGGGNQAVSYWKLVHGTCTQKINWDRWSLCCRDSPFRATANPAGCQRGNVQHGHSPWRDAQLGRRICICAGPTSPMQICSALTLFRTARTSSSCHHKIDRSTVRCVVIPQMWYWFGFAISQNALCIANRYQAQATVCHGGSLPAPHTSCSARWTSEVIPSRSVPYSLRRSQRSVGGILAGGLGTHAGDHAARRPQCLGRAAGKHSRWLPPLLLQLRERVLRDARVST